MLAVTPRPVPAPTPTKNSSSYELNCLWMRCFLTKLILIAWQPAFALVYGHRAKGQHHLAV